jgi:hypothetical protein
MSRLFDQIFLAHPRSVDEGYFEHFNFAVGFSVKLFGAAFAALVHALLPCIFKQNASVAVRALNDQLQSR